MIKLKINNTAIEVESGMSILEAAKGLGLDIPTMCYLKGYSNHPSCMVCMVKDVKTGKLYPSCAYPVQEGMEIVTDDEEVIEARKDALELLLSDHVGECEARCRVACPAYMDIPKMNRLIAAGDFHEAHKVVKEEIALPLVLGYVCEAPCQNACRRNSVDETVSICQLKKYVAVEDAKDSGYYLPEKEESKGKSVAIIGSGPTGLAAAFHLTQSGFDCTVIDRNSKPGGSLASEVESKALPADVLEEEIKILKAFGVTIKLDYNINNSDFRQLTQDHDFVLIATGVFDEETKEDFGLELNKLKNGFQVLDGIRSMNESNVYIAGSAVRKVRMAVQAVAEGKAAAFYIRSVLEGVNDTKVHRKFNSKFGKLKGEEISEYLKESNSDKRVIPQDELAGFDKESVMKEAARCLRCDCRKSDGCKLRLYADEYGARQNLYKIEDRPLVTKSYRHDKIVYEPEKCIRCSLCVDIAEKEKESLGLTHIGRGFDVRIGIPFNESLEKSLTKTAIKCALHCPTAAISLKKE